MNLQLSNPDHTSTHVPTLGKTSKHKRYGRNGILRYLGSTTGLSLITPVSGPSMFANCVEQYANRTKENES